MNATATQLSLLVLAALITSCAAPPSSPKRQAKAETTRTATAWTAAVRGLDRQIAEAKRVYAHAPTLANRQRLSGLLLESSTRLGRVSALDRVVGLAEEGVRKHPRNPRAYVLRAKAYGAVHRFDDALADLERAAKHGALESDLRGQRATILMGLGRLDTACPILTEKRKKHASYVNLTLEAMCLGKQGKLAQADAGFAAAKSAYRDVSPFILAWIDFERGAMWDRAGRDDEAREHYRSAVRVMPVYAHAAGHLAYMLEPKEAKPLLERVLERSDDPEYLGALAHVAKAPTLDRAKRGYEELMKRQPLAFADHAGWFYLVVAHDADRALEAAELNADNRPTPDAHELLIAAQLAARDPLAACDTADTALAHPYPTRGLRVQAARALERCGRADEAAEISATVRAQDARLRAHFAG